MIAGYCWPQSVLPGEAVSLAVSADHSFCDVQVVRIGSEEVSVGTWEEVSVIEQAVPVDAAKDGCGWQESLNIEIAESWTSGFYLVRLTCSDGENAEAFFVVRASEPRDTLLVLSTSTWAAYNDWGGPSYYTGGNHSSLRRPLPKGFLEKPDPHRYRVARIDELSDDERRDHFSEFSIWSCAAGFANWELLFVRWAERQGIQLDYATSLDLHSDPHLLSPYSSYLSVGHDEYWSAEMRNHLEDWIDRGGFAAFFSGNTAFWQVRFEDPDHTMVGFKQKFIDDPVVGTAEEQLVTTMWSDPLTKRPESLMTGVSFTRGGYAHCRNAPTGSGGYTVWQPNHWAFEEVDLLTGDIIGASPVVVGYECDGCELVLENGIPVAAESPATPLGFEVLATAPARLWTTEDLPPQLHSSYVGELNWVAERLGGGDIKENRDRFALGYAVIGSFRRNKGTVFTVGCTDWAYGLGDPAIDQITLNVMNHIPA
ncbi:MAG: N,N-dimethylformamidase beta subunit family domain-containing protein [Actinomycetota bacterium]|nr:N,N-dimethylformamidase beta subunit family domain-containing protein [Actinomycetota bacterium]